MKEKILLVEDEESLSRAISLRLTREGYTVHSADSLKNAAEIFSRNEIKLIICDIGMPDGSGLEFCTGIRALEEKSETRNPVTFLFLTALDTENDMINGYAAGADDYITKPFSVTVLTMKVNSMMKKQHRETSSFCEAELQGISSGSIKLFTKEKRAMKNNRYISLTATEYKLLSLFMENPMKVLSKNRLLEAVWDTDGSFVDDNTVAVNIRRLREKIEDSPSSPSMIKNLRGLGYIWDKGCEKF